MIGSIGENIVVLFSSIVSEEGDSVSTVGTTEAWASSVLLVQKSHISPMSESDTVEMRGSADTVSVIVSCISSCTITSVAVSMPHATLTVPDPTVLSIPSIITSDCAEVAH
jgi:hypothetical protein